MPLTEAEKDYIVEKVTEILRSADKKDRIAALREQVLGSSPDEDRRLDEAVYSVLQAIDELYG